MDSPRRWSVWGYGVPQYGLIDVGRFAQNGYQELNTE